MRIPTGAPFSIQRKWCSCSHAENDDLYLLATDQLGSVFAVADLTGNSLQEILYDSFGRMIQNSNSDHDLYLSFAAGLHDKDTGLIHFGYREYDPAIGRFITPDPLIPHAHLSKPIF